MDVGFGMPHESEPLKSVLAGSAALISSGTEPFSIPESVVSRLERLAGLGVLACISPNDKGGRCTSHMFSGERLDEDPYATPLSLVYTSREDGALLARRAGRWIDEGRCAPIFKTECTCSERTGGDGRGTALPRHGTYSLHRRHVPVFSKGYSIVDVVKVEIY